MSDHQSDTAAGTGLEQSEAKHRAVVENALDAVLLADDAGRYVDANPAACRLLGYERRELLGLSVWNVTHGLDEASFARLWSDFVGHGVQEGEYQVVTKDGRAVDVEYRAVANVLPGIHLSVLRDVTRRLRVERELRELSQHLEERFEARTAELRSLNRELETFSYSASHDLRSPLRGIDGFSRVLLEEFGEVLGESGRHYLERIRAGAERMGQLIDALLVLSRLNRQELRLQQVDLSELARQAVAELERNDPDRRVEVRVADGLRATGDRSLVGAVLRHLLDNAWKFTREREHAEIEFGACLLDGERVFFLRDNGAGFDPSYADMLFAPFRRLHSPREFEGTGIGLATAQRAVHRHGGRIWGHSEVGRGATFYFTLPGEEGRG